MKKSLVALAALALAGAASAQSSVTLFGVVDAAISNYSTTSRYYSTAPAYILTPLGLVVNPAANVGVGVAYGRKQSQTVLSNSGYNSSRIGFRGTEDLGGGLAASFWLEAPLSNDSGTGGIGSFARRSTVSLSGGFGEIRLGRDYTPTFWNDTVFDPFGTNGVGTNLISTINSNLAVARAVQTGGALNSGLSGGTDSYVRTSNSIGYFLPPNLGGFYGQVQYALHENVKNSDGYTAASTVVNNTYVRNEPSSRGRYVGGRFGYANGPLDVAVAYGQSTIADVNTSSQTYVGVNPLTGVTTATGTNADRKLNSLNLGASYDFGPVKLFGEVSQVRDKLKGTTASNSLTGLATSTFGTSTTASLTDKYNGVLVGLTAPVGPGLIRVAYSRVKFSNGLPGNASTIAYSSPPPVYTVATSAALGNNNLDSTANKLALGYVHNLSKRTALYATVSRTTVKNAYNNSVMGATAGGSAGYLTGANALTNGYAARSATGYDFGIRHAF